MCPCVLSVVTNEALQRRLRGEGGGGGGGRGCVWPCWRDGQEQVVVVVVVEDQGKNKVMMVIMHLINGNENRGDGSRLIDISLVRWR